MSHFFSLDNELGFLHEDNYLLLHTEIRLGSAWVICDKRKGGGGSLTDAKLLLMTITQWYNLWKTPF